MSISGNYSFLISLLIILLTATWSCKEKHDNLSLCWQNTINQYRGIAYYHTSDTTKIKQLKSFFNNTDPNCIAPIADSLFTNILLTWYANPTSDTGIVSFFSRTYNYESLPINLRYRALTTLSLLYYVQYNLKAMDSCLTIVKAHEKELDNYSIMSYCKAEGLLLMGQNKLQEASQITAKGIEIAEKETVKDHLYADLYSNYGNNYFQIGNFDEAIKIYKKSYRIIENTTRDYTVMQEDISNMGLAYQQLKMNDSALICYKNALALQPHIGGGDNNLQCCTIYQNIASIYILENKFDSARCYINKMIHILPSLQNDAISKCTIILSTVADAPIKDVSAGIDSIKSYIPLFNKDNDMLNLENCYMALNKIATLKKNDHEALRYTILLDSIKDVTATTENKRVAKEMETKYETAKKDLQIEEQKNTIAYNKNLVQILVAVILILVLGAVVVFQNIRLKQKDKTAALQQQFTKQLLENTEQERERIASDLHDGVCNDLTIVKHYIGNNDKATNKINDILEDIRQIARNLHPEMLSTLGLKLSIESLCQQMASMSGIIITNNIQYTGTLTSNNELHLFRIVQESLNNIVKHSSASNINITIEEKEQQLWLKIIDNGYGFNVEAALKSGKAFGLLSIMERAKAMGGKAMIESGKVVVSG